jgi:hypothetical protein
MHFVVLFVGTVYVVKEYIIIVQAMTVNQLCYGYLQTSGYSYLLIATRFMDYYWKYMDILQVRYSDLQDLQTFRIYSNFMEILQISDRKSGPVRLFGPWAP